MFLKTLQSQYKIESYKQVSTNNPTMVFVSLIGKYIYVPRLPALETAFLYLCTANYQTKVFVIN